MRLSAIGTDATRQALLATASPRRWAGHRRAALGSCRLVERRDLDKSLSEATAADLAVAIELGLPSVSRPVAEAIGVAAILDAVFGTHGDSDRS